MSVLARAGAGALRAPAIKWPVQTGVGLLLVALIALPLGAERLFSEFYVDLATKIYIYGLFLLSFDLLAGYTGLVSFGHALFFGLGAYVAALTLLHVVGSFWAGLATALVAAFLVAVPVGFLAIRTRGVYFVFITLAFAELFYLIAFHWLPVTGGENGLTRIPPAALGPQGLVLDRPVRSYYLALASLVAGYVLCRALVTSPFGHVLVGIRENQERMEFMGYDVARVKRRVFVLSGMLAAAAGALFAAYQRFVSPDVMHWLTSADAVVMTWLGGVGTLVGPVLGAAVVIYVGNVLSSLTEHWMILMGGVYVAFVLFSPRGIVGLAQQAARRWSAGRQARSGERQADP